MASQLLEQAIVLGWNELLLFHTDRFGQLKLHRADFLDNRVGKLDRCQHLVLGHLAGEALDHQDSVRRAGDDHIEIALLEVIRCGKGDQLAVDAANSHRCDRAQVGHRRNQQGCCRTVHSQYIAVVLAIAGEHHRLALHLVLVTLDKERTDGPVHQAGRECLFHRRATLTLEEPSGIFSGS